MSGPERENINLPPVMAVSLHDCYFCLSSNVRIADIGERYVKRYAVECGDCLACGSFAIDWFRAARAWNNARTKLKRGRKPKTS